MRSHQRERGDSPFPFRREKQDVPVSRNVCLLGRWGLRRVLLTSVDSLLVLPTTAAASDLALAREPLRLGMALYLQERRPLAPSVLEEGLRNEPGLRPRPIRGAPETREALTCRRCGAVDLLRRSVAIAAEEEDSEVYNCLDGLAWALHRRLSRDPTVPEPGVGLRRIDASRGTSRLG